MSGAEKKSYKDLKQGDIVFVDFNPTKGHEQRGYRPCMILTQPNKFLNYMFGVAPISSLRKKFPFHVDLPSDMETHGQVLLEHHRMIDIESRGFQFVEEAPKNLVEECTHLIKILYEVGASGWKYDRR